MEAIIPIRSTRSVLYIQGKSRGEMTVEERIAAADRRRMQGNDLFKEDKLEEAIQQYEMVTIGFLVLIYVLHISVGMYNNFFL